MTHNFNPAKWLFAMVFGIFISITSTTGSFGLECWEQGLVECGFSTTCDAVESYYGGQGYTCIHGEIHCDNQFRLCSSGGCNVDVGNGCCQHESRTCYQCYNGDYNEGCGDHCGCRQGTCCYNECQFVGSRELSDNAGSYIETCTCV